MYVGFTATLLNLLIIRPEAKDGILVADCGGGTVDISTYARSSGSFKEVAPTECIPTLSSITRYLLFSRPFAGLVFCQQKSAKIFDRSASLRPLRSSI